MGAALTMHPEFFLHVAEVRAGTDPGQVASRYVRRDQGQRAEALRVYFEVAAEADPHADHRYIKTAVWSIGMKAWFVDAPLEPGQPQRALRRDAIETMGWAAIRVARRGAGRCAFPDCCGGKGAQLAADRASEHCQAHAFYDRKPRGFVEIDRALFKNLLPALLIEAERRECHRLNATQPTVTMSRPWTQAERETWLRKRQEIGAALVD